MQRQERGGLGDVEAISRQWGAKNRCFLALWLAQTRSFASLSWHVILRTVPHTAARCCCNKQQHTPRAQQYTSLVVPCAHGKLDVKHHRTTPKPETHVTRQVVILRSSRVRSCAGEKIEYQNVYNKRHSHHHPRTRQQAT